MGITPLITSVHELTKLLIEAGADYTKHGLKAESLLYYCIPTPKLQDLKNGGSKTATHDQMLDKYGSYDNYYNNCYSKIDPTPIIDYLLDKCPLLLKELDKTNNQSTVLQHATGVGCVNAMNLYRPRCKRYSPWVH